MSNPIDITKSDFVSALNTLAREGNLEELVPVYEETRGIPQLEELTTSALVRAIKVCNKRTWFKDVGDLLQRTDLPDNVMIEAIKVCGEYAHTEPLIGLIERGNLSEGVMKATEAALIRSTEECRRTLPDWWQGYASHRSGATTFTNAINLLKREDIPDAVMITLIRRGTLPENWETREDLSDPVLMEAMNLWFRNRRHFDIYALKDILPLLLRTDLSDAVMLRAIDMWGQLGGIDELAYLLDERDLSAPVREAIEPALVNATKLRSRKTYIGVVCKFLKREDEISVRVMEATERTLAKGLANYGFLNLEPVLEFLEVPGISDRIRKAVEKHCMSVIRARDKAGNALALNILLERTDIPDSVVIRAVKVFSKYGENGAISKLLDRGDISDTVREAATSALFRDRPQQAALSLAETLRRYIATVRDEGTAGLRRGARPRQPRDAPSRERRRTRNG